MSKVTDGKGKVENKVLFVIIGHIEHDKTYGLQIPFRGPESVSVTGLVSVRLTTGGVLHRSRYSPFGPQGLSGTRPRRLDLVRVTPVERDEWEGSRRGGRGSEKIKFCFYLIKVDWKIDDRIE